MATTRKLRVLKNELQFLDEVVTAVQSYRGRREFSKTRRLVARVTGLLARMATVCCWSLSRSGAVTKQFRAATFR